MAIDLHVLTAGSLATAPGAIAQRLASRKGSVMFASHYAQLVICPLPFSVVTWFATLLAVVVPLAGDANASGGDAVTWLLFAGNAPPFEPEP